MFLKASLKPEAINVQFNQHKNEFSSGIRARAGIHTLKPLVFASLTR